MAREAGEKERDALEGEYSSSSLIIYNEELTQSTQGCARTEAEDALVLPSC